MTDHDPELDAIAAELEAAGLLTIEPRADGGVRYRLTPRGAQVDRQMALSSEADGDGMLDALLEGRRCRLALDPLTGARRMEAFRTAQRAQMVSETRYRAAQHDGTCVLCRRSPPPRWMVWNLLWEPWVRCLGCGADYCRHCRSRIEEGSWHSSTFRCLHCQYEWEFSYRRI